MKHYRIRVSDRNAQGRGMLEVSRQGRVVCLRGDIFIVSEAGLRVLDEMGFPFEVIREDDPEDALRAVRDSAASAA